MIYLGLPRPTEAYLGSNGEFPMNIYYSEQLQELSLSSSKDSS